MLKVQISFEYQCQSVFSCFSFFFFLLPTVRQKAVQAPIVLQYFSKSSVSDQLFRYSFSRKFSLNSGSYLFFLADKNCEVSEIYKLYKYNSPKFRQNYKISFLSVKQNFPEPLGVMKYRLSTKAIEDHAKNYLYLYKLFMSIL